MPFINICVAPGGLNLSEIRQLIKSTTELMTNIMNKKADRTTVHIQCADASHWATGNRLISEQNGRAVYMEIKITKDSNSVSEKHRMILASCQMLEHLIGAIPKSTYVVIQEIKGNSWGKAGMLMADHAKTQ